MGPRGRFSHFRTIARRGGRPPRPAGRAGSGRYKSVGGTVLKVKCKRDLLPVGTTETWVATRVRSNGVCNNVDRDLGACRCVARCSNRSQLSVTHCRGTPRGRLSARGRHPLTVARVGGGGGGVDPTLLARIPVPRSQSLRIHIRIQISIPCTRSAWLAAWPRSSLVPSVPPRARGSASSWPADRPPTPG